MRTGICSSLGIAVPIIAFSHCRDVVVEASKSGGMGVLGVERFTPEQLRVELDWIEKHIEGRPYGVDALFPKKYVEVSGQATADPADLLPQGHRDFVEEVLLRYKVPHLPAGEEDAIARERLHSGRNTPAYSNMLANIALEYPGVKLIVSAIGLPPPEIIKRARAMGIKVGAMVGTVEHAIRQRDTGVDLVIAQGYEAAGHTGEIATMVLVPQVVDAVKPLPVFAAGGIASGRQMAAALALGAEGVWCGSVWLTTVQSEVDQGVKEKLLAATSADTVRTRCVTGKPARFLKSDWSGAWEAAGAPPALPRPLQHVLTRPALARILRARTLPLMSSPVGQVVGQMNDVKTVHQVYHDMLRECAEAVERINTLAGD